MDAKEFAARWKSEKDSTLRLLREGQGLAAQRIREIGFSTDQQAKLWAAMDVALTDVFYTLLLGLDGGAGIGGIQEAYTIRDEQGNTLAGNGELEAAAYEQFHGLGSRVRYAD